jgi:hypothetical protein
MHGLTGWSWKRSRYRATATEKNDPTENRVVTKAPCPTADQRYRASSRPSHFRPGVFAGSGWSGRGTGAGSIPA